MIPGPPGCTAAHSTGRPSSHSVWYGITRCDAVVASFPESKDMPPSCTTSQ